MDFLTASNKKGLGDKVKLFDNGTLNAEGKDVVVIGGGDTAMDCVRTAVRQKAKSVKCLYRRDKENMPGSAREVANAEEEGVNFIWLTSPKKFIGQENVSEIEVSKMKLGEPDYTGRRKPVIEKGNEFKISTNLVIKSLGFDPEDLPKLFNSNELAVSKWGTIKIDLKTMQTNIDGVFAAGDIVRGASLWFGQLEMEEMLHLKLRIIFYKKERIKGILRRLMKNYKKNLNFLIKNNIYDPSMEHDARGVGLVASTNGKKSREIVDYGIEALKSVWHRGAVDADGKSGDGAGIKLEISPNFFKEKITATGHTHEADKRICVGMIFMPRNDYADQEKCRSIIETVLLKEDYYIYGWRQVPVNPKVLGSTARSNRPEIVQVLFRKNKILKTDDLGEICLYVKKKLKS